MRVSLDSPAAFRKADREGIRDLLEAFPKTIAEAMRIGEQVTLPLGYFRKYERVAFLAMGGSGSGADLLANWFPHLDVHSIHDYSIPPYVGPETLCLAITYSGKTEETIAAAIEAHRKGCFLFGIGGGSTLKDICLKTGHTHVDIPLKYQPTRIGTAFVTFVPAALLNKLGLVQIADGEMDEISGECGKILAECGPDIPEKGNKAKRFARQLSGLPVVVYAPASLSGVAIKMKNDLAENAKVLSKWELLPEGNHHDFSCWEGKPKAAAILLRSRADEEPQMRIRLDLSAEVLKKYSKVFLQLSLPETKSRMARITAAVYFGMLVSYYLRVLQGKSVAKTPLQDGVKGRMPKSFVETLVAGLT